jgi:hypothetical protein
VASFINPDVRKDLGKYRAMCDQQQSEGSSEQKTNAKDIVLLCEDNGNDWDAVVGTLLKRTIANHNSKLSKDDKDLKISTSDISDVTDYLNGVSNSMPEKFRDGNLQRQINALKSIKGTKIAGGNVVQTAKKMSKSEELAVLKQEIDLLEKNIFRKKASLVNAPTPESKTVIAQKIDDLEDQLDRKKLEETKLNAEIAANIQNPTAPAVAEKPATGNLCLDINDAIEKKARDSVDAGPDKTNSKLEAEIESIKKNPGRHVTGVNSINSKLASFDSEMVGDVASEWSEMGENATSCRSMAIGQRGMFDFMGGNVGQMNQNGMFNSTGR